jgi:hypothetical protein
VSQYLIPVSAGELLDKITILRIKSERITDPAKLANIRHELALLDTVRQREGLDRPDVDAVTRELHAVNLRLWDIEDAIREKEAQRNFDDRFIELARAVYVANDERAALKRRINESTGSELVEEKSYRDYRRRS